MSDRTIPSVPTERYLARIGADELDIQHDLQTLTTLTLAHLSTVPFENLDVFAGVAVTTDIDAILDKIVDRRRGGWCFEVNGAFCALLVALGFDARLIGAAVLLNGPTTVIDHAAIEVHLDEPWLVDVGFGDSFITPLALNRADPQPGGNGDYQLIASPQGTTVTKLDEHGVPSALFRFKRVGRPLEAFEPASTKLQTDPDSHFRASSFATRLIDGGPDRVTVLSDRIKVTRGGAVDETPIEPADHARALRVHMGIAPI